MCIKIRRYCGEVIIVEQNKYIHFLLKYSKVFFTSLTVLPKKLYERKKLQ